MRLIITNNPKTAAFITETYIPHHSSTKLISCCLREDVYTQVRDHIHQCWRLYNHAMYGNIQLQNQPYRSMILMEGFQLDISSLQLWEQALEQVRYSTLPEYPLYILEDFQELDFLLFSNFLD